MKLVQFFLPGKGKRVGVVRGDRVVDVTSGDEGVRSTLDLVTQGKTAEGLITRATWLAKRLQRRALNWRELQQPPSRRSPHLLVPIDSSEVWGANARVGPGSASGTVGWTWGRAYAGGAAGAGPHNARPRLFFKATGSRVAGPGAPIAIRRDSTLTVPEASVAAVLGPSGQIVALSGCTDATARDIERCGPEYLSQAKIYLASCALGPCVVTLDEFDDPAALQVRCSILRDGQVLFSEAASTAGMPRQWQTLVDWLRRDNPVPAGAVLSTGTSIVVPDAAALCDGDQVEVEAEGIGRLSNPVRTAWTPGT